MESWVRRSRRSDAVKIPDERDAARASRVGRRLGLIGPGPAAFYFDAQTIAFESQNLQMSIHFIGHALREVNSSLLSVLVPRDFVNPESDTQAAKIRAAGAGLGLDGSVTTQWLALAARLPSTAHRRALALSAATQVDINRLMADWDSMLDPLLERYESRYIAVVPRLEELASKTAPTKSDVSELRNQLPNNLGALALFFDKIQSGAWLPLVAEAGFFDHPPPLEYDADAGTVRAPRWPQAEYLARFPTYDPDLTARVVATTDVSENFRIVGALLDALNGLPPDRAVELAPNVVSWLRVPLLGFADAKVMELVERLVAAGFKQEATLVAFALIDTQLGVPADYAS